MPFDQFTDIIRIAADEGGASGFIAGRSVWREVVSLTGQQRQDFLTSVALPRLDRLITVAERSARPSTEARPGRAHHVTSGELTKAMAAAAPQGRALYEDTFAKMLAVMQRREGSGSPPDVPAATIVRALTATRPRGVYLTGKDSRRLAILSTLPTPVLDAVRRRIFRLPAPGSLLSQATG